MCLTEKVAAYLERHGWTRQIAGDADFDAAVRAVAAGYENGLGLIVRGEYGVGKTALAKIVANLYQPLFTVRLGIGEELEKLTRSWQEYFAENPYAENVFLDDLGAEHAVNDYGVQFERAGDFVIGWCDRADACRRLFITTNATGEQLDARYGGRFYSRLKSRCVPLRLTGGDKRHWTLT